MTLSTDMWGASNRINDQCRNECHPLYSTCGNEPVWEKLIMLNSYIEFIFGSCNTYCNGTCQPMTITALITLCLWYLTFFMCLLPWQGHAYVHQGCDSPSESQHITMTVDTSAMVASRVHFMEVLAKLLSFVMFHAWLMGLTQMVDWWHVWHSNYKTYSVWNLHHLGKPSSFF